MASVIFDHVTKRFGDVVAVNDMSLQIEDKEFLVLVGPSGCGKTTSLRLLAGLEEITEGHILIGDRVVNDVPPKDRDIAMVFQSYALYPHMTVFDNMAFGLRLRKVPRKRSSAVSTRRPKSWVSRICWTDGRGNSPAASASASPSVGPSSASPRSSCWTNPSPTWTPNCASRRGPKSRNCISASAQLLSTSPTTRPRP